MPELSRAQLLVYGAIAVAVLLVGARWIRANEGSDAEATGVAAAAEAGDGAAAEGDERFAVDRGGAGLVVHVAGEVRKPGVYRLPNGSRVADALERAGGATAEGAPDGINLAAELADGQQVVVPARVRGGGSGPAAAATPGESSGPISLGTATVEQLDTIEGIGPVTARDIIEFRDENGGIGSIEELDQISGIGPATMEALREALQP